MLKEVIVVEGKSDVVAVKKAVDAEIIITGGYGLAKNTWQKIKAAYEKRGIIILTDPDYAGELIRKRLTEKFPLAKQAFLSKEDAVLKDDIGVENASPEIIKAALAKVRIQNYQVQEIFSLPDMVVAGLVGNQLAARRRNKLGKILGLGYTNAKQFLKRLNSYGVTREEFSQAVQKLEE